MSAFSYIASDDDVFCSSGGKSFGGAPTPQYDGAKANLFNYKTRGRRTFLQDQTTVSTRLPRILPKGLPYAANFISFEDLVVRGSLQSSKQQDVDFSVDNLRLLYEAKCLDQGLSPSWERQMRFMELISANCTGKFFCLKESGLGPMSGEAIAHILSANKNYTVLDLSGNRLRDEGACSIAELVRLNKTLVHVGLRSNDVGHIGGVALANALLQNNTVVSVDLGAHSGINGNHIGTEGAEAIGSLLRANKVLSHLNLSSNGLGSTGVSFVASGLDMNYCLTHLDISINNIGAAGAQIMASIIETSNIKHLSLQRNNLTDEGGKALFNAIANAIDNGEDKIEYLNLEYNGLGEKTSKSLAKVLASSATLKQLRLSGNGFGSSSRHLVEALAENKGLLFLSLSFCEIRENDGSPFGNALSLNSTLQHLDLSHNVLKDVGTKHIAEAMKANAGLVSLNLSCNRITDEGGKAIASFFKANRTLKNLNLRRNSMSNVTGELLDEQLRENTTLEKMDVTYNDFRYKCLIGKKATLDRNAGKNKAAIVPKLKSEIEGLSHKEKELSQVEDEIEMERRIIKDRSEQLLRRNEEARVTTEKARRDIQDLEKNVSALRVRFEAVEDVLRRTEERVSNELATLAARKSNMNARIQQEKDRTDRMHREMDRMRRQIKQIEEAEATKLQPLLLDIAVAESDRDQGAKECKYEGDKLAAIELQRKDLEQKLGLSVPAAKSAPLKGKKAK